VLFKCLLLQQWYRLSDPGLEEALGDRLSFRRFVGLSLDEAVPDHSTLSRFRTRLGQDGLAEQLFDELNGQLSAAGLILRQGTLIDATVVQADATPFGHERAEKRSDKDAGFTLTRRGYRLGYKAHLAMDKGSRLIRRAILTPANGHDSHWPVATRLVQGDEACVYADTAYDSREFRAHLGERGVGEGVLRRGHARRPLTPEMRAANARLARERVAIEGLFGLMKRGYGFARVRYRTLHRNATQLQFCAWRSTCAACWF
jgi:IS5 family transposase